jgi:hypothetical protein
MNQNIPFLFKIVSGVCQSNNIAFKVKHYQTQTPWNFKDHGDFENGVGGGENGKARKVARALK